MTEKKKPSCAFRGSGWSYYYYYIRHAGRPLSQNLSATLRPACHAADDPSQTFAADLTLEQSRWESSFTELLGEFIQELRITAATMIPERESLAIITMVLFSSSLIYS